jgi:hypothetical protein
VEIPFFISSCLKEDPSGGSGVAMNLLLAWLSSRRSSRTKTRELTSLASRKHLAFAHTPNRSKAMLLSYDIWSAEKEYKDISRTKITTSVIFFVRAIRLEGVRHLRA